MDLSRKQEKTFRKLLCLKG